MTPTQPDHAEQPRTSLIQATGHYLLLTAYIATAALLTGIAILNHLGWTRSAPEDWGPGSINDQLQCIRAQIELYRMQHNEKSPALAAGWNQLLYPTNIDGVTSATYGPGYDLGPYMQSAPVNTLNGQSDIGPVPSTTVGWILSPWGSPQAVDASGHGFLSY